jgi:hypothetical protein
MIADLDEFILPLGSLSVLTTVSKFDIDTVMGVGIRQCTVGAEKGKEKVQLPSFALVCARAIKPS